MQHDVEPAGTAPAISVIVPVFNDAGRLEACLAALEDQVVDRSFEVIVADNGLSDDPAAVVDRFERASLVVECRPCSYAARNAAVARARGKVLAFTDSDGLPDRTWLAVAARRLDEAGRRAFLGGRVELFPADPTRVTGAEMWEMVHGFPQQECLRHSHFAVTANMVTWASAMDEVGRFDDSLKSGGDREWGVRAHAQGYRPVYAPDAVVRHPCRRSLRETVTKIRRQERGVARIRARDGRPLIADWERRRLFRPPLRYLARTFPQTGQRGARSFVRYSAATILVLWVRDLFKVAAVLRVRIARRGSQT
jgi:glycosyltransferase involved in cell wall biosynthesis